ncbi:uncharacterized protein LOC108227672 isoform X2 [Daucus carota subsp. sativus]|uniref:uncharacterized protein LOC108227672 isoform X2 n=1 Tax=Daucus carota subsp. sativus TaxID=79200 RepID=UPI0007F04A50|nr:PREDICTED: chaperone protein DnaJ-like [Daucus carota subsp. sativus]
MDAFMDHYEVLGLPSGEEGAKLSEQEIKKAYRSRAKQLHPDKRPDDPNAHPNFLALHASYEFLMDKKSRQKFHQDEKKREENKRKLQQQNPYKRDRNTDVDERERAGRAARYKASAACKEEELIRRRNEEVIAALRRDAAASKVRAVDVAGSGLNGEGEKEAASSQCPCGHCRGNWPDREFSGSSLGGGDGGFEARLNSFLTKKDHCVPRYLLPLHDVHIDNTYAKDLETSPSLIQERHVNSVLAKIAYEQCLCGCVYRLQVCYFNFIVK